MSPPPCFGPATRGQRDIVCLGKVYGRTQQLFDRQLPTLGIPTHCLNGHDSEPLERLMEGGTGRSDWKTPTPC